MFCLDTENNGALPLHPAYLEHNILNFDVPIHYIHTKFQECHNGFFF